MVYKANTFVFTSIWTRMKAPQRTSRAQQCSVCLCLAK